MVSLVLTYLPYSKVLISAHLYVEGRMYTGFIVMVV